MDLKVPPILFVVWLVDLAGCTPGSDYGEVMSQEADRCKSKKRLEHCCFHSIAVYEWFN